MGNIERSKSRREVLHDLVDKLGEAVSQTPIDISAVRMTADDLMRVTRGAVPQEVEQPQTSLGKILADKPLHEGIAFMRERRGWDQERMTKEGVLDPGALEKYERGESIPKPTTLSRLLEVSGLDQQPEVVAIFAEKRREAQIAWVDQRRKKK